MVNTLQKLCERRIEKLVRKTTCQEKDPVTRSLVSLTEEQLDTATRIAEWVELMPVNVASDMFDRVLAYDGDDDRCDVMRIHHECHLYCDRKMTPMDVVALLHPGIKQLTVGRREGQWRPLPNTHKAILDTLYGAQYLQHLNISGVNT